MSSYAEAVAEAKRLGQLIEESEATAEQAKWDRAKLSWEQVQAGKSRKQWAHDIGVNDRTVDRWYIIWERWGAARAPRPQFSEAFNIVSGRAAEVEEHGSQHAARIVAGVRNMPPERKATLVREAMADPMVAQRVVADRATEDVIDRARVEVAQRRMIEHDAKRLEPPNDTEETADDDNLIAFRDCMFKAIQLLRKAHQPLLDMAPDDRRIIIGDIETAIRWATLLQEIAANHSFDKQLAELLEGK